MNKTNRYGERVFVRVHLQPVTDVRLEPPCPRCSPLNPYIAIIAREPPVSPDGPFEANRVLETRDVHRLQAALLTGEQLTLRFVLGFSPNLSADGLTAEPRPC